MKISSTRNRIEFNPGGLFAISNVAIAASVLMVIAPYQLEAQEQGKAPQVIVTAPKSDDLREARHLARDIADTGGVITEPLARFSEPVCPSVHGVSPEVARRIERRIRDDAQRAGIPVSKGHCETNLAVEFVTSGQATIKELLRKGSPVLTTIPSWRIAALVKDTSPVHIWSIVESRSRDGDSIGLQAQSRTVNATPDAPLLTVRTASIIQSTTRRDIDRSFVLLDIPAMENKKINQVADYVAMRGLAQTKLPTPGSNVSTILDLFKSPNAPASMTTFDNSYLRSVYWGQATQPALTKRLLVGTAK